jgi:hypothetical protein
LRRSVQKLIENPLSNLIIEGKFKERDKILAKVSKNKIVFEKIGAVPVPKEQKKKTSRTSKKKKK